MKLEFYLITALWSLQQLVECVDPTLRIVNGFEAIPLKAPLFYENSVDLLWVVDLPEATPNLVKYNCTSDKFLCDLESNTRALGTVFQKHWMNSPFLKRIKGSHPEWDEPISRMQRSFLGLTEAWETRRLHDRTVRLNAKLDASYQGLKNLYNNEATLRSNLTAFNQELYNFMKGSTTALSNAISTVQYNQTNDLTTVCVVLQNLQLLLYHIDTVASMDQVAQSCLSNLVPRKIIPDQVLIERLKKLSSVLHTHGWKIVGTLNTLFALPLCRCTFTEDKVYISITIPLMSAKSSYDVYKIITLPFGFNQSTCSLNVDTDILIRSNDDFFAFSSYKNPDCDLSKGLCKVSRKLYDQNTFSSCAKAVFANKSLTDISKSCIFKCKEIQDVVVTDLDDEHKAIIFADQVITTCRNGTRVVVYDAKHVDGTMIVKVPCECQLLINRKITVHRDYPCKSDPTLVGVLATVNIPVQWTRLQMKDVHNLTANLRGLTKLLDQNWPEKVPSMNFTPTTTMAMETGWFGKKINENVSTSHWIMAWLGTITVIVIVQLLQNIAATAARNAAGYQFAPVGGAAGMALIRGAGALEVQDIGKFINSKIQAVEISVLAISAAYIIAIVSVLFVLIRIYRAMIQLIRMLHQYLDEDDIPMSQGRSVYRSPNRRV